MVRKICLMIISVFFTLLPVQPLDNQKDIPVILQVDGHPQEIKQTIEQDYPRATVIETYEKLFHGIALQAPLSHIKKLMKEPFVSASFQVATYQAAPISVNTKLEGEMPSEINSTDYTGKGVKVAVIDTGIDYSHPDLSANFKGGYNFIHLNDDPMETLPTEGPPTNHGTHVAGIIAANGDIKGVAPDADIYVYKALGPGGQGTSIQVMAALERAVEDGVDVINLSLGNSINGPDFPTSIAVNRAVELGVGVVIANGNDGPDEWTIGSPATAQKALSVGAKQSPLTIPYVKDPLTKEKIILQTFPTEVSWDLTKDYPLLVADEAKRPFRGKIVLATGEHKILLEEIMLAESEGAVAVIIKDDADGEFISQLQNQSLQIPVVTTSEEQFKKLLEKAKDEHYFIQTGTDVQGETIASFSSKGPVLNEWTIKPDVIAPGTNILSTVPGGHEAFYGTSMAAPHVTGMIAVLKEAKPHWSMEQIIQSIKTTAQPLENENGQKINPIAQGMGAVLLNEALQTNILIDEPLLSFGKVAKFKEKRTKQLTIENLSGEVRKIHFHQPKWQKGITWELPQTKEIGPKQKVTLPLHLHITKSFISEDIFQDWLVMTINREEFHLPFVFINEQEDYEKVMGLSVYPKPFVNETYEYQFYATEPFLSLEVELFQPITLLHEMTLFHQADVEKGLNKGEVQVDLSNIKGEYIAMITIVTEEGEVRNYETTLVF